METRQVKLLKIVGATNLLTDFKGKNMYEQIMMTDSSCEALKVKFNMYKMVQTLT